jgi:hypothetical protein
VSSDTTPASSQDADGEESADPTVIPTGGGPSGRTPLAMLSFVILSMVGATSMLLWSRGSGA